MPIYQRFRFGPTNDVLGTKIAAAMIRMPIFSRGGPHSLAAHAVKLVSASIRHLSE
jgi:hypothetical protein